MDIVDLLKSRDMLDCLRLLHYHLGSQIPNIRDIRTAVMESTRIYAGLAQEGARMGYLDLGGGLAVDYDGSHTNYVSSRNYSIDEYCTDVIEAVMAILDQQQIPHPHIVTESGRLRSPIIPFCCSMCLTSASRRSERAFRIRCRKIRPNRCATCRKY